MKGPKKVQKLELVDLSEHTESSGKNRVPPTLEHAEDLEYLHIFSDNFIQLDNRYLAKLSRLRSFHLMFKSSYSQLVRFLDRFRRKTDCESAKFCSVIEFMHFSIHMHAETKKGGVLFQMNEV